MIQGDGPGPSLKCPTVSRGLRRRRSDDDGRTLTTISERMLMILAIFCPRVLGQECPPSTPIGTPLRDAQNVISNWPTNACRKPPPSTPAGAGSLMNSVRLRAALCTSTSPSMKPARTAQGGRKRAQRKATTPSRFPYLFLVIVNTPFRPQEKELATARKTKLITKKHEASKRAMKGTTSLSASA